MAKKMDLELAYRSGRMTSRDITLMSNEKVTGVFKEPNRNIPVVVVGCSFVWEQPYEIVKGDQTRTVKVLTPWIYIRTVNPPIMQMPVRLSDRSLELDYDLREKLISAEA